MKFRLYFVALILCCCVSTYAQQPESVFYHIPCYGDVIKKQQVSYKDLGRSGRDVLWDMSDVNFIDNAYTVQYMEGDSTGQVVKGIEHKAIYSYALSSDSLLLTSFENNTTKTLYDRPVMILMEPLIYGTCHEGLLHGYSVDCDNLYMRILGAWLTETDATGMLILPEGDTLRHVTRVHHERILSEHRYSFLHTEEDLKMYVDSIIPFTQDSILSHLQNDSVRIGVINNRWYADGYRYPVFETIATGVIGTQVQNVVAYYYPPSSQEDLYDPDNEEIRNRLAREDDAFFNGSSQYPEDGDSCQNQEGEIQFTYNVHCQDGHVTVDFYNSAAADITCGIYTYMGMTISEMHEAALDGGTHNTQFDISGQHPGVYMLVIKVNDKTYTEKINKK